MPQSAYHDPPPGSSTRSGPSNQVNSDKELPPHPATRLVEKVQEFPSHQTVKDQRWLEPINESATTWRAQNAHQRARPPPRLDLKLAKVEENNPRLRAVSSETSVRDRQAQADTTPKRRFLERIRAFPIKPSYPAGYKYSSQEQLVAAPKKDMPHKAARFLGTSTENESSAQRQPSLPNFGALNLPEPNPPFANDELNVKKVRQNQAEYSPRMMRENSDPRLLVLNDRIASKTNATQPESVVATKAVDVTERVEPPRSPLRRVHQRIGEADRQHAGHPVFGFQAPDESEREFNTDRDTDIRVRSGAAKQPSRFPLSDSQNALSICGSLHDTTSNSNDTSQHTESVRNEDQNGDNGSTTSTEGTPEIHWPIVFRNENSLAQDDSASTFHPSLAPSPLHFNQQPLLPRTLTRDPHDTLTLLSRPEQPVFNNSNVGNDQVVSSQPNPKELSPVTDIEDYQADQETPATPPDDTPRQPPIQRHPPKSPQAPLSHATTTPRSARMASNQPWRSLSNTPTFFPDTGFMKAIESKLDTQRRELFELKGDVTRNDNAHMSRFDKLENRIDGMHKDVKALVQDFCTLKDLLVRTPSFSVNIPPFTSSSTSSHTNDGKTSPRRSGHGPPSSFPAHLTTIRDASPVPSNRGEVSPARRDSKHSRHGSGSSDGKQTILSATTYDSPRRRRGRRGRSSSNATNSIELTPTRHRSSVNSAIFQGPPQNVRTASNASSVRNAIQTIERKASNGTTNRVATADEVFARTPSSRHSATASTSRTQSPSKSLASKGMAAMKRALSPTRAAKTAVSTPADHRDFVRENEYLTRSAPTGRDAYGLEIEDLADFGIGSPTTRSHVRRPYASENGAVHTNGPDGGRSMREWASAK
ncbi:MAG: hypothetical protein Q9162_006543 [Coniocarpon cinnabarinum]